MDETVFCVTEDSSVLLWTGNPDCQTAHNEILTFLSENCAPFITDSKPKDNILRGNLGETITFCLGRLVKIWRQLSQTFAKCSPPF